MLMDLSQSSFVTLISGTTPLVVWVALNLVCTFLIARDLRLHNPQTPGLMQAVWILTALYSGPIGLAVYFYSGRRQIPQDNLWRRSFRSVAHCYSGCGAGEIVGVILTAGVLALGTIWVSISTFILAYVFGFALTVGPLMADGMPPRTAIRDSFLAETASITVMEVTAIGVGLWLSGGATMGEPLFWTSLLVSLTAGLFAAYPVNVALIKTGVKSGMGHPGDGDSHCH